MEVASAVFALDARADPSDLADEALLQRNHYQQGSQEGKEGKDGTHLSDALHRDERDSFGDSQRLRIAELDLGVPGSAEKVHVAVRVSRQSSTSCFDDEIDTLVLLGRLQAFESGNGCRVVDLLKWWAEHALRMLKVKKDSARKPLGRNEEERTALRGVLFSSSSHRSQSQSSSGVPS